MLTLPSPLAVQRYHLHGIVEQPVALPEFAGSALRGAFGHALRALACSTGLEDCTTCPQYRHCAYPAVFETPPPPDAQRNYSHIPNPYVIEPPAWGARTLEPGATLDFSMVLLGPALTHLPMILLAWQHALEHNIAGGRVRLTHVNIDGRDQPILAPNGGTLQAHVQTLPPVPTAVPASVTLHLHTPLRLQSKGQVLGPKNLAARELLLALVRRTGTLMELQLGHAWQPDFGRIKATIANLDDHRELHWLDWGRYSTRQHRAMRLGGVVGNWQLSGDMSYLWPLLYLGQWIHVGKNATFGLGGYRLST